jgi:hypothetical protein
MGERLLPRRADRKELTVPRIGDRIAPRLMREAERRDPTHGEAADGPALGRRLTYPRHRLFADDQQSVHIVRPSASHEREEVDAEGGILRRRERRVLERVRVNEDRAAPRPPRGLGDPQVEAAVEAEPVRSIQDVLLGNGKEPFPNDNSSVPHGIGSNDSNEQGSRLLSRIEIEDPFDDALP